MKSLQVALWVMYAPGFKKQSTGLTLHLYTTVGLIMVRLEMTKISAYITHDAT